MRMLALFARGGRVPCHLSRSTLAALPEPIALSSISCLSVVDRVFNIDSRKQSTLPSPNPQYPHTFAVDREHDPEHVWAASKQELANYYLHLARLGSDRATLSILFESAKRRLKPMHPAQGRLRCVICDSKVRGVEILQSLPVDDDSSVHPDWGN